MKVGDVVDAGTPFPGMAKETLKWVVVEVSSKGVVTLDVTWHGVSFCRYQRKNGPGDHKPIWRKEETS